MPEFTLVEPSLFYLIKLLASSLVFPRTAFQPLHRLMALAPAIIRGLHITNTIKSLLDAFIVVRGSGI